MSADRGSAYPLISGRAEHLRPQGDRARRRKSDTRVLWAPVDALGATVARGEEGLIAM